MRKKYKLNGSKANENGERCIHIDTAQTFIHATHTKLQFL